MTVRTWITLSLLLLVAMTAAAMIRLFAPLPVAPPAVIAYLGDSPIKGELVKGCWPQKDEQLRCYEGRENAETAILPADGTLRVNVAYPAQPEDGTITITNGRKRVLRMDWDRDVPYDLDEGSYTMTTQALYPDDAYVTYRFSFRVR